MVPIAPLPPINSGWLLHVSQLFLHIPRNICRAIARRVGLVPLHRLHFAQPGVDNGRSVEQVLADWPAQYLAPLSVNKSQLLCTVKRSSIGVTLLCATLLCSSLHTCGLMLILPILRLQVIANAFGGLAIVLLIVTSGERGSRAGTIVHARSYRLAAVSSMPAAP